MYKHKGKKQKLNILKIMKNVDGGDFAKMTKAM